MCLFHRRERRQLLEQSIATLFHWFSLFFLVQVVLMTTTDIRVLPTKRPLTRMCGNQNLTVEVLRVLPSWAKEGAYIVSVCCNNFF